jgi:hypothetical protein
MDVGRHHPVHQPPQDIDRRPTIIFLTICTNQRRPLLARPPVQQLLIKIWSATGANWQVGRYVIMPDHLHYSVHQALLRQSLSPNGFPDGKPMFLNNGLSRMKNQFGRKTSGIGNSVPMSPTTKNGITCARIPRGIS